jgi:hypothetical protein
MNSMNSGRTPGGMLAVGAPVVNRHRGDTSGDSVTRGGNAAAKRHFAVG